MIKSYFKTAVRFLLKNKAFSFINILGLAIGTMCCLYIVLYVKYQYSYDKHYNDAENIYRVNTSLTLPGGKHNNATSSPPIAPAMKKDFAEVVQFTRFIKLNTFGAKQHLLKYQEKSLTKKMQPALILPFLTCLVFISFMAIRQKPYQNLIQLF
jgi:putative ABC transport system permease protein